MYNVCYLLYAISILLRVMILYMNASNCAWDKLKPIQLQIPHHRINIHVHVHV